jgi:hypothetical protein
MKITMTISAPFAIALLASALLARALPAQDFDFKALDKLGANAKSHTSVTLDADMLKLAARFLGSDDDKDAAAIKSLVGNLKGIYVRSYEFDRPGQYTEADLAPLLAILKQPRWKNVMDVFEDKESTQLYFLPTQDHKLGGVALVSTEPTSLTVVYIDGVLDESDLYKLSGNMGIPEIKHLPAPKTDNKVDNKKTSK